MSAGGQVLVDGYENETVVAVALGGNFGVFTVGANITIEKDTSAQKAHIDDSAQITKALGGISVHAHADRGITEVAFGGGGGFISANGSLALALVGGDATATVGNVALGGAGTVTSLAVTVDDTVHAHSHAISVGAGAVALAGGIAWTELTGTAKASSNAHGTVGSGGISVTSNGDHGDSFLNPMADTVNIAIGVLAGGITLAHAEDARSTEATMNASPTLGASIGTSGAVTVAANARNHATAISPGGGGGVINVNVMLAKAIVSGATRAQLDGSVTSSSSVTVAAHADTLAYAKIVVVSVSIAAGNVAFPEATVTSDAAVEALLPSDATITSSGAVKIEARTLALDGVTAATTTAKAEAFSGALGAFAGTYMSAKAHVDAPLRAKLDGDVLGSSSIAVTANGANLANASTVTASLTGFSGSGSGAEALVSSTAVTEALVGSNAQLPPAA